MEQFNLQITIDAYQDVTWEDETPGYGYQMTIEGTCLQEPVEVVGSINSDHSLKSLRAANTQLISSIASEVRSAVERSIKMA